MSRLTSEQAEALTVLADGIIPADEKDRGAAEVNAGPTLAARVESGRNAEIYLQGLEAAAVVAQEKFAASASELTQDQAYEVLLELKSRALGFYKQLRMDVAALYLSDPGVWGRIGFPGPAADLGGYPDFDQPQLKK